jgi:hypothetical protein
LASAYPSYTSAWSFQAAHAAYDWIVHDSLRVQKTYRVDY